MVAPSERLAEEEIKRTSRIIELVQIISRQLIERLIERAGEIEAGLALYDPRDYGLRETLRLLGGGM